MKTILVATDYSAPANNAVEYAAQLARESGAELILFHVYKLSVHASNSLVSTSANIDNLIRQSESRLAETAAETATRFGITVRWELGKDDTIESLKTYTASDPVDLVVMGIESNLPEYRLFGNTTTAAVRLMKFPLLVVPNDIQFHGINRIMYACEASYVKEAGSLDVLKDFAKTFHAPLDVFHVITHHPEQIRNEQLEELIGDMLHDVDHHYRYVHNSAVKEGIEEGLQQQPADLLVMIHHRLGFFESLVKGSHTSHVTLTTRVPLLVLPGA